MRAKTERVTHLDYCQYLLVSQINYTLRTTPSIPKSSATVWRTGIWPAMQSGLTWSGRTPATRWCQRHPGFLVLDDTIVNKNFLHKIDLVRRQYSGNAHGIIEGIGVVTCVYVNPETEQFWIIDYRIYDPAGDGKTKLDHVTEMLRNCVYQKQLALWAVLMDT